MSSHATPKVVRIRIGAFATVGESLRHRTERGNDTVRCGAKCNRAVTVVCRAFDV